jgi:hypothetical protein
MKKPFVFLLLLLGCSDKEKQLLCQSDADCSSGLSCELVSGLCKPNPAPSRFAVGASGAFDCEIVDLRPGRPPAETRAPGLATVVPQGIARRETCDSIAPSNTPSPPRCTMAPPGPRDVLKYLQTGCEVTIYNERFLGVPGERAYYRLRFTLIDGSYDNPAGVLTFQVREADLGVAEIAIGERATALYEERCTDTMMETELELRSVATCGSLDVTAIENGRIKGTFDVELLPIELIAKRSFGERCHLTRSCAEGCADVELRSAECLSGVCAPDPRDPSSPLGFCGGACEDSRDCRAFEHPANFCLWTPQHDSGHCIRLCDPGAIEDSCAAGTTCRPGADFPEFPDGTGPARCLDQCIPTPSQPDLSRECLAERGDAGVPPPEDAGVRDAESPPDAGREDTGPVDTGFPDSGAEPMSPLGQTCSTTIACPGIFYCGSRHETTTTGACTRPCAMSDACSLNYQGPGIAVCNGPIRNVSTNLRPQACAIICGPDLGGDGTCPGDMMCADLVNNNTRMPPADGALDFCIDPP